MATPQTFNFTAEDIRRAEIAKQIREARLDPEGIFTPAISGDLTMDLWDINSLRWQPEPVWLIENMVEEKGLTIFFGPDKVGKTAMVSHFLWSYAAGQSHFLDEDFGMHDPSDRKRSVVYVLLEGQASYYHRYEAWCAVHNDGKPIENFYVANEGLSLFEPKMRWDDRATWTDSAVNLYNAIIEAEPAILVIDTLSRSTAGMNENSPEMAQVIGWLDYVRDTLGTASIIVHHVALDKAESARPRGHSSLKGAASSYVHISGDPDDKVLYLKHGPHRNAESGSHGYGFVRTNHGNAFIIDRTMDNNKTINLSGREEQIVEFLREQPGQKAQVGDVAEEVWGANTRNTRKYAKGAVEDSVWVNVYTDGNKPSLFVLEEDPEPEEL